MVAADSDSGSELEYSEPISDNDDDMGHVQPPLQNVQSSRDIVDNFVRRGRGRGRGRGNRYRQRARGQRGHGRGRQVSLSNFITGRQVSLSNFITFCDRPTYVVQMLYTLFWYTIKG